MFTVVGALFLLVGLVFVANPFGLAAKYVRFAWRTGSPRPGMSPELLARRLGTAFLPLGCGLLAARLLLALGVEEDVLMGLLPVGVVGLFAVIGTTLYLIYRDSSRGPRV
ncbi:hypothetical protein [Streptomyces sp. NPDC057877]|uniref:hypothetical protein n=1 Tax=Streptomyces sp. NPDC057877 TaxID=3346269 RepID=UPI0036A53059